MSEKPKIFLSYRREDSEGHTGRIYDRLYPHFGRENVFMDVDTIPFGVDFREHLDQAVGQCDVLLAIIGESWLDIRYRDGVKQGSRRLDDPTDFVRIEIASALTRKIPVVPVLVGRATMPAEQALPEALRSLAFRNAAEVRPGRDFHDHVDRLIRGIDYLQAVRQPKPEPPVAVVAPSPPVAKVVPPAPAKKEPERTFTNSIGMQFVLVEPGTFLMGSPVNEANRGDNEKQHEVTLTKAFYMGIHPVTVGQWRAFAATGYKTEAERGDGAFGWTGSEWEKDKKYNWQNPGFAQDDSHPVTCVSWNDAVAFCEWLKKSQSGHAYRLPSEAEWEYTCRDGGLGVARNKSQLPFHFAQPTSSLSSTQANFDGRYPYGSATKGPCLKRTSKVGSYEANALGIFDMHGNVWEWCADWYGEYATAPCTDPTGPSEGSLRVLRGGGWSGNGQYCRAAFRSSDSPSYRYYFLGFRVVQVPGQ